MHIKKPIKEHEEERRLTFAVVFLSVIVFVLFGLVA